jgi:hypothetical protein
MHKILKRTIYERTNTYRMLARKHMHLVHVDLLHFLIALLQMLYPCNSASTATLALLLRFESFPSK